MVLETRKLGWQWGVISWGKSSVSYRRVRSRVELPTQRQQTTEPVSSISVKQSSPFWHEGV